LFELYPLSAADANNYLTIHMTHLMCVLIGSHLYMCLKLHFEDIFNASFSVQSWSIQIFMNPCLA